MIYLRVEPTSGVPLGMQIGRQLRLAVATGRLKPGERLPAARDLAAELSVNFHTVRKAYSELESEGILVTARGRGTFVAQSVKDLTAPELRGQVRMHLARLVEDLAGAGVSPERLAALVEEELGRLLRPSRGTVPWESR
jgi:GntR family transcriptional regulator